MKKSLNLLICILMLSCSSFSTHEPNEKAQLLFETPEYSFGKLSLNQEAEYKFCFSNTGKVPIIINDVKSSCGCTIPIWPKTPIKPGSSGEINIKYDTAFPGIFFKEIKVHYNGTDSPIVLRIKGQVEYSNS